MAWTHDSSGRNGHATSPATAIASTSRQRSTKIVPPISIFDSPVRRLSAKIRATSPARDGSTLLKKNPTLTAFVLSQVDTRSGSTKRWRQRIPRRTSVTYTIATAGTIQIHSASARLAHTSSRATLRNAIQRQSAEMSAPSTNKARPPVTPRLNRREARGGASTPDSDGSGGPAGMRTECRSATSGRSVSAPTFALQHEDPCSISCAVPRAARP
jgi:hypothetical protein